MKPQLKRIGLVDLFGVIIAACLIFVTDSFVGDPGVGWHFRNGEWVATHGEVPRVDQFLFTAQGKKWVSDQWLSDLLCWKLFQLGGYPLIHLTVVGIVISIFILVLPGLLQQLCGEPLKVFMVVTLAAFVCAAQWIFRPVIISFLFLTVVLRLVYGWYEAVRGEHRSSPWHILLLPLIFLAWVNFHPAFPLGLVVLFLALLSMLYEAMTRRSGTLLKQAGWLGSVFVLSGIATCLNPYGVDIYQNILSLFGNDYFMNLNSEWIGIDFHSILFVPMLIAIILLVTVFASRGRSNVTGFDLLLLGFFLFMAFEQRRYVPFFGIVLTPILTRVLASATVPSVWNSTEEKDDVEEDDEEKGNAVAQALRNISRRDALASRGGYTVLLFLVVLLWTVFAGSLPFRQHRPPEPQGIYPVEAVDKIATLEKVERIFHTPDWGGYLTWRLWPRVLAFIDDRNGLNSAEIYEEFFMIDRVKPGWTKALEKYRFDTLLLRTNSPLGFALEQDSEWEIVFQNDSAKVLKRRSISVIASEAKQ